MGTTGQPEGRPRRTLPREDLIETVAQLWDDAARETDPERRDAIIRSADTRAKKDVLTDEEYQITMNRFRVLNGQIRIPGDVE